MNVLGLKTSTATANQIQMNNAWPWKTQCHHGSNFVVCKKLFSLLNYSWDVNSVLKLKETSSLISRINSLHYERRNILRPKWNHTHISHERTSARVTSLCKYWTLDSSEHMIKSTLQTHGGEQTQNTVTFFLSFFCKTFSFHVVKMKSLFSLLKQRCLGPYGYHNVFLLTSIQSKVSSPRQWTVTNFALIPPPSGSLITLRCSGGPVVEILRRPKRLDSWWTQWKML